MKQLLIISGKGGTGKTTVAGAFIKLLQARAYADCDVDAPNLHLIVNHSGKAEKKEYHGLPKAHIAANLCIKCGLCEQNCRFDAIHHGQSFYIDDYACEGCGVCQYVCPASAISLREKTAGELMLYKNNSVFSTAQLKMGNGTSGMLVSEVKKQMKDAAAKDVTIAIIDGSPGIGCPVIASLSGVDLALIVTEPSISGISDLIRMIKTARQLGTAIAVCINKYDTNLKNTNTIEKYCSDNKIAFVGKIPYDKNAITAINDGKSIVDVDCPAANAIKKVFNNTLIIKEL
ncbi:MAG: ATP-binding protein [Clostridia bacterium]